MRQRPRRYGGQQDSHGFRAASADCPVPGAVLFGINQDRDGVPGQGTPDPTSNFFNHFIVSYGGKYYDPSYGTGPFSGDTDDEARNNWENSAIAGYLYHCPNNQDVVTPNDPNFIQVTFSAGGEN
jgi:hypothetical protein